MHWSQGIPYKNTLFAYTSINLMVRIIHFGGTLAKWLESDH